MTFKYYCNLIIFKDIIYTLNDCHTYRARTTHRNRTFF